MIVAGLVLAGIAAALHVYIFYMESIAWTSRRVRAVFGTTAEEARTTKELAFNQGFYNLFLAVMVAAGIAFFVAGQDAVGAALVFAGAGAMTAAAAVLVISSPKRLSAALAQGAAPALGVIALAVGLIL
ncbi:DUF1304 domain-containing protein [Microbacterium sp. No. 7]|uniref:DUF1304 domain-containing protein n=1 Tax=Microbacterium sp. No. 7 TaxID=1714373 RepID=UPI0006D00276|nr:DUF1304 domain-containing protein [Microbacterium sp. No. 7]ALJ19972.1 hypothetical protein AOA12_08640 [Microbacterium sp. No. 7]